MSRIHIPPIDRPDITLPDGRVIAPIPKLAAEFKVHPRTLKRKKLPLYSIGGVKHAEREAAAIALVGEPEEPRNQPRR